MRAAEYFMNHLREAADKQTTLSSGTHRSDEENISRFVCSAGAVSTPCMSVFMVVMM